MEHTLAKQHETKVVPEPDQPLNESPLFVLNSQLLSYW